MKAKLLSLLFIFALTAHLYAQQAKKEENISADKSVAASKGVRLALINKVYFEDEKTGILELVNANKQLNNETYYFSHITRLRKPIDALEKELQNLSLTLLERKLKEQEFNTKRLEYEQVKKSQDEVYEKRRIALTKHILDDIEKEIDKIEKQNNIIFLDAGGDEKGMLLWADLATLDFTKQFIDYYNNRKQTNADFVIKTEIPEFRIALINRQLLVEQNITQKSFVAEFAKEKGFDFILESSLVPEELKSPIVPDITKEFVAYFKERNP